MSDHDPLTRRALQARAGLQAATSERPVPPLDARPGLRTPTVRWSAPLLAAAVVLGVVIAGVWSGSGAPKSVVASGSVASVEAGQSPTAICTDGDLIWVADAGDNKIRAFDAHTLRQQWTATTGARPVAMAAGLGAIWVVTGDAKLLKLDPRTGHLLKTARTSLDPVAIDVAFGKVWILAAGNRTVDRYDPTTVAQTGSAILDGAGTGLTDSIDALWVVMPDGLRRIDPATTDLQVRSMPIAGSPRAAVVDSTNTSVWVQLASGGVVTVDPATGAVKRRVALSAAATALTRADAGIVVSTADGRLQLLTTTTANAALLATTGVPLDALAVGADVLVGTSAGTTLLYATEVAR